MEKQHFADFCTHARRGIPRKPARPFRLLVSLSLLVLSSLWMPGDARSAPMPNARSSEGLKSSIQLSAPSILQPAVSTAVGGITSRVSLASDGTQGDSGSYTPSISPDGRYVVFSSYATNLVISDTNETEDVFVRDRQTGQTERLSVSTDGAEGDSWSYDPFISADGRYVAFLSYATNLVSDDTNGAADIFVRDRQTGQTERISVASDGTEADGASGLSPISTDGRCVVLYSDATNLVPDDTNGYRDIFVRDRQTARTERVSLSSDGTQADDHCNFPSMSADGRYVAFDSDATNLVSDDTNSVGDVFVHDRQTGHTERVSVASNGAQGSGYSGYPSLSDDGRYVAFKSYASNLVVGDTNDEPDIFVHDRQTGQTVRVSVASDGTQADAGSPYADVPSISGDGCCVAFRSTASNLVANDTNGTFDIFVHDRQTGQTRRASVDSDGTEGNGWSGGMFVSISADGTSVAFDSQATNLVSDDTNGQEDIFVHTLVRGTQSTVLPGIADTLIYTHTGGSSTTVGIPANAVTDTITLVYSPIETVTAPSGFSFAGHAFSLEAYHNGLLRTGFLFEAPITVTISYSDALITVSSEDTLELLFWDGNEWSSDGITIVERDTVHNQLTVTIAHLSDFALFGEQLQVYLPAVLREAAR